MCGVAVDVAGVVEQVVLCGDLPSLVHVVCPLVQVGWPADEVAGGNLGGGVECREEQVAVDAVHAAAEPRQTVGDVLTSKQAFESGKLVSVRGVLPRSVARWATPVRRAMTGWSCRRCR